MFFKKRQPSPTHDSPERERYRKSTCSQTVSLRSKQQSPGGLKLVASWFGPGNPSHGQPCRIFLEKPAAQASQVFFKERTCKKEDWLYKKSGKCNDIYLFPLLRY
eukprot:NP_001230452.1 uncharacterized protein LOC100130880 [Homo sapiens]